MDRSKVPECCALEEQELRLYMSQAQDSASSPRTHLHVSSGLRPSSSGQSTDSGIVVDAEQEVWSVGNLRLDHHQQRRWDLSSSSSSPAAAGAVATAHAQTSHENASRSASTSKELVSASEVGKKLSEINLGACSSANCNSHQSSSSRHSVNIFDRQMKSNFLEAKLRVEESLHRLQMCKTFKDFQAEFVGTGRAIVDLACLTETKLATTDEHHPQPPLQPYQQQQQQQLQRRTPPHMISDAEIATRFGIRIKHLSNKCCHAAERCQRLTEISKYDHLILAVKKIAVLAWKTYLFTRAEPPLMTSTDLFRSVYETALVASSCSECVDSCLSQIYSARADSSISIKCFSAQIRLLCDDIKRLMRSEAQGRDAVFQKVLMALEGMCSILELIKDLLSILYRSEDSNG